MAKKCDCVLDAANTLHCLPVVFEGNARILGGGINSTAVQHCPYSRLARYVKFADHQARLLLTVMLQAQVEVKRCSDSHYILCLLLLS